MKQWEYDNCFAEKKHIHEVLEERGEQGWEAWDLRQTNDCNNSLEINFKRKTKLDVRETPE